MKKSKQDLERQLRESFSHAVPDVKDEILRRCATKRSKESAVIPMDLRRRKKHRNVWSNVVAVAAVILLAVQFGFYQTRDVKNRQVETVIDLDVNPSIELGINSMDRIASVKAVNEDAANVLGDMQLEGTQTQVAVNAILGAMLSKGYLSENANSILISVDNKDETKSQEIQEKLVDNVDSMLQACSVDAAILSQSVASDDTVSEMAASYDISAGRMSLINKIIEKNPAYSVSELASLTVNELNLLISAQNEALPAVTTKGTVSEAAYIGMDKAIEIALADQQMQREDADGLQSEIKILNARMVYCVSYLVGGQEYVYSIDALDGSMAAFEIRDPQAVTEEINGEPDSLPESVSSNLAAPDSASENTATEKPEEENDNLNNPVTTEQPVEAGSPDAIPSATGDNGEMEPKASASPSPLPGEIPSEIADGLNGDSGEEILPTPPAPED